MGACVPIEAVRIIGKYALIEKLGEGYLGPVYRGFDQDLGRAVAIRILCDGIKWDPKFEESFRRECRSVSALQHRNIAAVFEVGKEGHSPYIVMESLGGNNLEALIAQKTTMPAEAKLSIMIQVAEGMSHAHKNGVLHHDLGPAKIHLMPDGGVKIRDFVIAYVLKKRLPHPVVRWGVPIYLSPEQIQQKDCDERSEIFSIGTIFYELLTGHHPFHDPNSNKALDNIVLDAQIPTFEEFPDVPPGIWIILKTCLARDPNDRYRSMDELASACGDLLKSMADDTQLVLAELYASLAPLRKAAAQPDASKNAIGLLREIEELSRGAKKADYTSLDRLSTLLIEQYPVIQAAASAPDPVCPQLPQVGSKAEVAKEVAPFTLENAVEKTDVSPPEQPAAAILAPGNSEPPVESAGVHPPSAGSAAPGNKKEYSETASANTGGSKADPHRSSESNNDAAPRPSPAAAENPSVRTEQPPAQTTAQATQYRRIPRPSHRVAAALLAILVLAAAGYIILETEKSSPVRDAWNLFWTNSQVKLNAWIAKFKPGYSGSLSTPPEMDGTQASASNTASILLNEARALAAENRFTESRVLIGRVLEMDPADEAAITVLREIDKRSSGTNPASGQIPEGLLARVSALVDSGKLQSARREIDRLQQSYPEAPEIMTLRKRWQAKISGGTRQQARTQEKQQNAALNQNETEWNRQLAELVAAGKYNEASGALSLWLAANPGSAQAQEFGAKINEIQRGLQVYTSAMSKNRYQDALSALRGVEKINPADPNLAEMRRQIESRKAAARAVLTVRRLGTKGTILLDGRRIGNDGEIESESIPIGSHTLAIENKGGLVASNTQEYQEGQRVSYVYDIAKLNLRPMTGSDRELLARRKAMEEVHRFKVEHDHGLLRGSCRGTLSVDYLDVVYQPASGAHGFQMPLKQLKLRGEGKSVDLFYVSDNQRFQSFKFQDEQTAERFKRTWGDLKAITQ